MNCEHGRPVGRPCLDCHDCEAVQPAVAKQNWIVEWGDEGHVSHVPPHLGSREAFKFTHHWKDTLTFSEADARGVKRWLEFRGCVHRLQMRQLTDTQYAMTTKRYTEATEDV